MAELAFPLLNTFILSAPVAYLYADYALNSSSS
jgi:hypothetical protein